jgi:hypothetical protein
VPDVVTVPGHNQIACMLDDFCWAVLHKVPIKPAPDEAVQTLLVMDALALSAAEGREIDV